MEETRRVELVGGLLDGDTYKARLPLVRFLEFPFFEGAFATWHPKYLPDHSRLGRLVYEISGADTYTFREK